MPTTVNGIGTHYYGKTNRTTRTGNCRACGHITELESYDTRLFFVVIFVPIIPLGRKRIIDQCSVCQRHFVASQDQYAAGRQLALSGALDQYRQEPSSETAAATHGQMVAYHAFEEAKAFRGEALQQFPDDASMYAAFAVQLDAAGDYPTATDYYERAWQLRPDLPEARDGLALRRIVDGKLDEARELLNHLEAPGAGQLYPLMRVHQLADAYQKAGRHKETSELCQVLLRELPLAGQDYEFRKFVRRSEKALRAPTSHLPARQTSWRSFFDSKSGQFPAWQRRTAFIGLVVLLAAGGMALLNEYYRQNRRIDIHNAFLDKAIVTIDGIKVPPGVQSELKVSEGKHRVHIEGAIEDEFEIEVKTGYWERWTWRPAWVVNVGGATPLIYETLYYSKTPRPSAGQVLAGEKQFHSPHVDYFYQPPPPELQVSNTNAEVVKTRLAVLPLGPEEIFPSLMSEQRLESALQFAESRLMLEPHRNELMNLYVQTLQSSGQLNRGIALLRRHLDTRPVLINSHRMYQELHPQPQAKLELAKQYDAWLAQTPTDAALLYLRGRLAESSAEKKSYFEQAIQADPKLGWPWLALGYRELTRANWQQALEHTQRAVELGVPRDDVSGYTHIMRCGMGEYVTLEQEYRRQLAMIAPHLSLTQILLLCDVLIAQDRLDAARQVVDEWEAKVPQVQRPTQFLMNFRALLSFLGGDFPAVEKAIAAGQAEPTVKLSWLLTAGRQDEAVKDPGLATTLNDPWYALAVSISYSLDGNLPEAAVWREKACEVLVNLEHQGAQASQWLRSDTAPEITDLDEVDLVPYEKAVWVATLAMKFPEKHAVFTDYQKRFVTSRSTHYHLMQRVIKHPN